MVKNQSLNCHSGKQIPCEIDSVCIHGDNKSALATAMSIKKNLIQNGLKLKPLNLMKKFLWLWKIFLLLFLVTIIKAAKKYEKKGKTEKANKKYEKALGLLLLSDKEKPNKADTLNYLGFTTRKLGDYAGGEKYYLQGLTIEPNHNGINEYLGELYVVTNRIDLAKERLEVLKSCNCEEYDELKAIIDGKKKSKY